jgi:hypothetical protein
MIKESNPNAYIRDYVTGEGADGWKFKDKAEALYDMSDVFRHYFFSPRDKAQHSIPNLVLAFPEMDHRALAAYRLVPNALGLSYEISLNAMYIGRPLWELCESLLHEMVHLYQEETPGLKKCVNGYHNTQFVDIGEEIGLHPLPIVGAHWKPADGQFERLMDRYIILKPKHAEGEFAKPEDKSKEAWWDKDRGKSKGRSTLFKFSCNCNPPFNIRTGRSNLTAMCLACNGQFQSDGS